MADDLELAMRSIEGEGPSPDFVATLRERVVAEAAAPRVVADDEVIVDVQPRPLDLEERSMTKTRWMMVGAAAAVVAAVVGLVAVTGDDDTISTEAPVSVPITVETDVVPTTTAPTTTAPQSAGTPGADADAGCGLSDSAVVAATVDATGESVAIVVTSDPACSGVEVKVVATPATQGFPIEKFATLDDTGAASVSDHLLSTRKGAQSWLVELIVTDTGGVAASSAFAVTDFCDVEAADLRATHLSETNEVEIVLTVDPRCAGRTFAFDDSGLFASRPSGGWRTYVVDEVGRIEVIEQLVVEGPVIDIYAYPVPEERGILGPYVARVTLDIGS